MDKHKNCKKHEDKKHECECEHCTCHEETDLNYQTNLEEKVLEYVQTAQRLQADFDNYRKKSLEQIAQSKYDGMADAVTKMMPVLDSIASAKKMIKEEKLLEGFVMIENQLLNAFLLLGELNN